MNESKTDFDSSLNTTKVSGTDAESFSASIGSYTFSMPKKSAWTVELIGNVFFTPDEGKEPNWLHRKMHELVFGFKWRKKDG